MICSCLIRLQLAHVQKPLNCNLSADKTWRGYNTAQLSRLWITETPCGNRHSRSSNLLANELHGAEPPFSRPPTGLIGAAEDKEISSTTAFYLLLRWTPNRGRGQEML